MNIAIVGSGRAASALAIAASRAGHMIVSVEGRNPDTASSLRKTVGVVDGVADFRIVAVSDDALPEIADVLSDLPGLAPTVHVSGAVPVSVLAPMAVSGAQIGSMHPLQTFPDAERGAARLDGAWMAITADEPLRSMLHDFAGSIGSHPFDLADDVKPLYHAAAAAAANYTLTTLDLSLALFEAAGVPFEAAHPLVEAIVANAFDLGPAGALTGPVARGDGSTVAAQVAAIRDRVPQAEELFIALTLSTAMLAGTTHEIERALA